ncbi:MAG: DNA-binding protein [Firmicutes bacterium]|nr:DNA-binding protein [Bacillota bacterium]
MEPKMYAYQCTRCGELHHPRHFVCRKCGNRDFAQVPLEGEAALVTHTRVYNLPEGYMKPFLIFGIARFSNGLCVSGQLEADHPESGMKLKATVGVVKEGVGRDYYGFIFKGAD